MTSCFLTTVPQPLPLSAESAGLKFSLFSSRAGRPDVQATKADPGAARDVRIHDFPITRWIWRRLRAIGRRMRAVQQRRRIADGSDRHLRDLGLQDRDLNRTAQRTFWYL